MDQICEKIAYILEEAVPPDCAFAAQGTQECRRVALEVEGLGRLGFPPSPHDVGRLLELSHLSHHGHGGGGDGLGLGRP